MFSGQATEGGFNLIGAPFFIGLAIVLVYFVVIIEATMGATLGKILVNLRVVKETDGAPIGWSDSVVRNVVRVVDALFFYLVGFVMVCTTQKHQRLGDKVAGTVVIHCRA